MPELAQPFDEPLPFPFCVCVPKPPEEFCVDFPFGVKICSNRSTVFRFEGLDGLSMKFLGNLQSLLAPIMPILVLASIAKAVIDCIKAIPDAISSLSANPILECLERLAELFPQLLEFIPPFSYLNFVNNILLFLISLLEALIDAVEQALKINLEVELDLLPDIDRLRCCLDGNITAFLDQIAAALRMSGPIFLVIAQILTLLELPGLKKLITPLKEAALQLNDITSGADLDPGVVDLMRQLQSILRDISNVITAIGASPIGQIIQKAQTCDCD